MKHIKGYIDHSNRDKVQWIKVKPVKSSVESKKLKELISLATEELFEVFYLDDSFKKKLDKTRPILKYGLNEILLHSLLSFNNLKDSEYYNKSSEAMKSADKKSWHEMLGDKTYLPKTVTDTSEIKTLEFPIICKPAEGHSGLGIMKFDTFEECEKEISKPDCKLDTFSEMVKDIDTEYRFVFCKNELFLAHERIPIKKENKTITTKKADEELKFLYIEQDLEKFQDKDKINDILFDFRKYVELDFFALDILVDKNGKYWLIESNSNIGMGGNTLARAYEAIYKDYYKKDVPQDKQVIVDKICKEYYQDIAKIYPEEIKDSKLPKTYGINESIILEMDRAEANQEAAEEAYAKMWSFLDNYILPEYGEKTHTGDLDLSGFFENFIEVETENEPMDELVDKYYVAPDTVNGSYDIRSNSEAFGSYINLQDFLPKKIKADLFMTNCSLSTLEDLKNTSVGGGIDAGFNKLKNLVGSHKKINGDFSVCENPLESLKGCPEVITGDFDIIAKPTSHRKHILKTLEELPKYIKGNFNIENHPDWNLTKEDLYTKNKLNSPKDMIRALMKSSAALEILKPFCDKKLYKEFLKKYKGTVTAMSEFGFFDS